MGGTEPRQLTEVCDPGSFSAVVLELPHTFLAVTLWRQIGFSAMTKLPLTSKVRKHEQVHNQVSDVTHQHIFTGKTFLPRKTR